MIGHLCSCWDAQFGLNWDWDLSDRFGVTSLQEQMATEAITSMTQSGDVKNVLVGDVVSEYFAKRPELVQQAGLVEHKDWFSIVRLTKAKVVHSPYQPPKVQTPGLSASSVVRVSETQTWCVFCLSASSS